MTIYEQYFHVILENPDPTQFPDKIYKFRTTVVTSDIEDEEQP